MPGGPDRLELLHEDLKDLKRRLERLDQTVSDLRERVASVEEWKDKQHKKKEHTILNRQNLLIFLTGAVIPTGILIVREFL